MQARVAREVSRSTGWRNSRRASETSGLRDDVFDGLDRGPALDLETEIENGGRLTILSRPTRAFFRPIRIQEFEALVSASTRVSLFPSSSILFTQAFLRGSLTCPTCDVCQLKSVH
jgi:hypothetical protein